MLVSLKTVGHNCNWFYFLKYLAGPALDVRLHSSRQAVENYHQVLYRCFCQTSTIVCPEPPHMSMLGELWTASCCCVSWPWKVTEGHERSW